MVVLACRRVKELPKVSRRSSEDHQKQPDDYQRFPKLSRRNPRMICRPKIARSVRFGIEESFLNRCFPIFPNLFYYISYVFVQGIAGGVPRQCTDYMAEILFALNRYNVTLLSRWMQVRVEILGLVTQTFLLRVRNEEQRQIITINQ